MTTIITLIILTIKPTLNILKIVKLKRECKIKLILKEMNRNAISATISVITILKVISIT